jgi:hypothetical protein
MTTRITRIMVEEVTRPDWWNYPVACGHGASVGPGPGDRVLDAVHVRPGQGGAGQGAGAPAGVLPGGGLPERLV